MESELLKEWTAEERKEAAEKATKEATEKATYSTLQTNIHDLLEVKFNIVSEHISAKLQKIQDAEVLRSLSKTIIKADTIEEYEQHLDKALHE
ncbi:MAG: hypothetical protein GX996_00790 [Firmicutes bacterium]|nr:hypothetical protein [Bacillota bacterium]